MNEFINNTGDERFDQFLGKWVLVKSKDGREMAGELQFVGTSKEFPNWGLHCTVGRTPGVFINGFEDISIVKNTKIFK